MNGPNSGSDFDKSVEALFEIEEDELKDKEDEEDEKEEE